MQRIMLYTGLAIVFIAIITVSYLPILFTLKKKGKIAIRQLSYLLLFCSIFLIIFATILFTPITFKPERYILNPLPFDWLNRINPIRQFTTEVIPNIILFIPFGLFIPIVFKRARKLYITTLVVFSTTFGIEFFQYFIGRSSDIDDIITNLLGGIIGYVVFKILEKLLKRKNWWEKLTGEG